MHYCLELQGRFTYGEDEATVSAVFQDVLTRSKVVASRRSLVLTPGRDVESLRLHVCDLLSFGDAFWSYTHACVLINYVVDSRTSGERFQLVLYL